jgi:hypothetical protein
MTAKKEFKPTDGVWPEHPLFPAEGDDVPLPIAFINIYRYEPSGPVQVLRTFRADELTSLEQIANLYGGGMYEIVGRRPSKADDSQPGNKVRQQRVRIPGDPLPLAPGGVAAKVEAAPPEKKPEDVGVMGMFMQMMVMQQDAALRREEGRQRDEERRAEEQRRDAERRTEEARRYAEQQQAAQARFTELVIQMNAQSQNTMTTIMGAVLSRTGEGGTESLTKMVEVLKGLGMKLPGAEEAAEGGTNVGEVMRDVADTVQGVAQIMAAQKGGPVPVLPKGPVGEGSAASILKPQG